MHQAASSPRPAHTLPSPAPAPLDRAAIAELGWAALARSTRHGIPLSLACVLPDPTGSLPLERGQDRVTAAVDAVGEVLRGEVRDAGTLARWTHHAFVVLLPDTGIVAAHLIAERLLASLGRTLPRASAGIGVAEACEGESWNELVERAEHAAERSRRGGGVMAASPPRAYAGCESIVAGAMHLAWRPAYTSGHPLIDAQHRQLFALANEALGRASQGYEGVRPVLDRLLRHCEEHFADEERILAAAGYGDLNAHARSHRYLVERAQSLRNQCDDDLVDLATLLAFVVRDVVAMHVLREDRAYVGALSATR